MRKRGLYIIVFATRMNITSFIPPHMSSYIAQKKESLFCSFYVKKKVNCHRRTIAVDKVITFENWSNQKRLKRELRSRKCYPNKIITFLNNLKCEKILFLSFTWIFSPRKLLFLDHQILKLLTYFSPENVWLFWFNFYCIDDHDSKPKQFIIMYFINY